MTVDQHLGFPFVLGSDLRFREQFPGAPWVGDSGLFDERNTSITTSHKSRSRSPSILKPASKEIISDAVELWDTDVRFLHIQLMGTNVRLPKIHKLPTEVDFESSRSPAKSKVLE